MSMEILDDQSGRPWSAPNMLTPAKERAMATALFVDAIPSCGAAKDSSNGCYDAGEWRFVDGGSEEMPWLPQGPAELTNHMSGFEDQPADSRRRFSSAETTLRQAQSLLDTGSPFCGKGYIAGVAGNGEYGHGEGGAPSRSKISQMPWSSPLERRAYSADHDSIGRSDTETFRDCLWARRSPYLTDDHCSIRTASSDNAGEVTGTPINQGRRSDQVFETNHFGHTSVSAAEPTRESSSVYPKESVIFTSSPHSGEPSREISLTEIDPAVQYFDVVCNTSSGFRVRLQDTAIQSWHSAKPWSLLDSLPSTVWNGNVYRRGDIIYVRTGLNAGAFEVFEIAEIRDLGDSRNVMRGFWYYHRSHIKKKIRTAHMRIWPRNRPYIKSTHMDVIMWDCATGHLPKEEKRLVVPEILCDMSGDSWVIEEQDAENVSWARTG